MKGFMLLLALYSAPDARPSYLVMPGTYTQAECGKIKKKFDDDHAGYFGGALDNMERVFVRSSCAAATVIEVPDE